MKRFSRIYDNEDMGVTYINNAFINHFMPRANGDYVRVYLYGLKYSTLSEDIFPTDTEIAKTLGMEVEDVKAAWDYWASEGIISVSENGQIDFINVTQLILGFGVPKKRTTSKRQPAKKIQEMFASIENKIARPLNVNEQEIMLSWYYDYKLTPQVIELIIDYSLDRETGRNISYWQAIADNFHDFGITSYDQANAQLENRKAVNKRNREVLKYLGQYRMPTTPEADMINKWFNEYGFDMDTVKKACDESTSATKPNVKYVDAILTAWKVGGDIPDNDHKARSTKSSKTRLANEHNYDADELEKLMFGDD